MADVWPWRWWTNEHSERLIALCRDGNCGGRVIANPVGRPCEVTDAMVEVLAERLYARHHLSGEGIGDPADWLRESEPHKDVWRGMARVDLEAALAATEERTP